MTLLKGLKIVETVTSFAIILSYSGLCSADCSQRVEVKGVCKKLKLELMGHLVPNGNTLDNPSAKFICVDAHYIMPKVGPGGVIQEGSYPAHYEHESFCEADGKTPRKLHCLGDNSHESNTLNFCGPMEGYVVTLQSCPNNSKEGDPCTCFSNDYGNSAGTCQDAIFRGKPDGQLCSRGGTFGNMFGDTRGLKTVEVSDWCPGYQNSDSNSSKSPGSKR